MEWASQSVSELLTSRANDHSFKKLYTKRYGVSELVSESVRESVNDKHSKWSDSGQMKKEMLLYKTEHFKTPDTWNIRAKC